MILKSKMIELNEVEFPDFKNERFYMIPFFKNKPLPSNLSRWQKTIDQMLLNVTTNEELFLMIDQQFVKKGTSHRRPGIHIDGYWDKENFTHTGKHRASKDQKELSWENSSFNEEESLILASSETASRGFVGEFISKIKDMGDSSEVDISNLKEVILEKNKAYCGNITFLHESLEVPQDCFRTLVRVNVPKHSFLEKKSPYF